MTWWLAYLAGMPAGFVVVAALRGYHIEIGRRSIFSGEFMDQQYDFGGFAMAILLGIVLWPAGVVALVFRGIMAVGASLALLRQRRAAAAAGRLEDERAARAAAKDAGLCPSCGGPGRERPLR